MTIEQSFQSFLYNRSVYCSEGTLKKYQEDIMLFFRFLEENYQITVESDSFSDLSGKELFQDFIIHLRTKNKKIRNSSIRSYCRSVKAYLRYCYEEDICVDYLKHVKMPKDDAAPKFPLYDDEVKKIDATFDLSTEQGMRNYCIVHLMLDCGLRRQEVLHLQVEHLDVQRNIVNIVDSKGMKSRFVLIPTFLLDAIHSYLSISGRSSGLVFFSLVANEPLGERGITILFQKLKKVTGIARLHPHLLRHTFATSYLIGGGNLEFLRVFMGHYDYNVTRNYSSLAAQCKMLGVDIYKLDSIFFTRGY